jgi:hypothetical protein
MSKIAWSSILAVLVIAAGGGAYYYIQHRTAELPASTPPAAVSATPTLPESSRDEDMKRRKLEGIGSTRDLTPVQIPHGNAK